MQAPHQPPGAISDPFSSKAFSSRADRPDQDGQHDGGFLYKQAGRDTLPSPVKTVSLSVAVVQCSFSVSQSHTCSRALKPGAGPSLQGRSSCEGVEIAPAGGGSDMGPLRQGRSGSFCLQSKYPLPPVLFHNRPQHPPGNALAHTWPNTLLYAFHPVEMILSVLERVRQQGLSLILVAPRWPAKSWYAEIISLLAARPWQLPLRRDFLSQAGGVVTHPRPKLWRLHAYLLRGPI